MTKAIELAKQCGIAYYLTPEGTTEMHGTDRQIEAFAELVADAEREACLAAVRGVMLTDHAFNTWKRCIKAIKLRALGNKGEAG